MAIVSTEKQILSQAERAVGGFEDHRRAKIGGSIVSRVVDPADSPESGVADDETLTPEEKRRADIVKLSRLLGVLAYGGPPRERIPTGKFREGREIFTPPLPPTERDRVKFLDQTKKARELMEKLYPPEDTKRLMSQ